jgi:hypothetical protein
MIQSAVSEVENCLVELQLLEPVHQGWLKATCGS